MDTDGPDSPLEFLQRAQAGVVSELTSLVPRLIDRTRRQVELIVTLAERLGCSDDARAEHPSVAHPVDELADVVPIDRAGRSTTAQVIEVMILDDDAADDADVLAMPTRPRQEAQASPVAKKAAPVKKKAPAAKKRAAKKPAAAKKVPVAKKPAATTKAPAAKKPPAGVTREPELPFMTEESALAIPDYDALAASQVIPRLDGLNAAELETLGRYEAAHRGRRTILGRVAQIQAG